MAMYFWFKCLLRWSVLLETVTFLTEIIQKWLKVVSLLLSLSLSLLLVGIGDSSRLTVDGVPVANIGNTSVGNAPTFS